MRAAVNIETEASWRARAGVDSAKMHRYLVWRNFKDFEFIAAGAASERLMTKFDAQRLLKRVVGHHQVRVLNV
jgi:hypothetical protein